MLLCACSNDQISEAEKGNIDTDKEHGLLLDMSQFERLQLRSCTASETSIYDSLLVRGIIDAPPQSTFDLSLPYGGQVTAMNYHEGAHVKKGAVMAKVAHLAYIELQEQYLKALAQERQTQLTLERQQSLKEESSTSERLLQEAIGNAASARAGLEGLAARLKLSGIDPKVVLDKGIQEEVVLRAPVDGFITSANAHLGSFMAPNEPIYSLVDSDHLHVELKLYQDQIGQVYAGQQVKFSIGNKQQRFPGEVFLVSNHLDGESRSINVHVHPLEDIPGMMVGMYVEAWVMGAAHTAYALPPGSAEYENGEWIGLKAHHDHWEKVTFSADQILNDGRVLLAKGDSARYVCGNLARGLAYGREESEGRGHNH